MAQHRVEAHDGVATTGIDGWYGVQGGWSRTIRAVREGLTGDMTLPRWVVCAVV